MQPKLTINELDVECVDPAGKIKTEVAGPEEHLEIWLSRQDGAALSALINATHSFLVWMTSDCPEGWHSQADDAPWASANDLSFKLANGQIDLFAEDLCVSRIQITGAFQEFWANGERPSSINWCYT